jgi:phosphoenolpyruvate carboxykinase (ATP)
VYHFLSGYTAKVAGTELGIKEPQATFSACFGAPFMILPPTVYAKLFMKKIRTHHVNCWLLNTGWAGKPYGQGDRIPIAYSRALIKHVLDGSLDRGKYEKDPLFGFMIPTACHGVPSEVLNPRNAAPNKTEYEAQAKRLAAGFKKNFRKFESEVSKKVLDAMP